ncbi:hypothetical protein [Streptomyces rectiverticillatus]|uniref:hypothetical protein n=1 Tax=Streptomyces rectiverticillatus TaxID=173860 RepID=UPI0031B5C2A7
MVAVEAYVRFREVRWQVVALAGQRFHLVGEDGPDEVVLAGHLFADADFAVLGMEAEQPQAVPRWGLFETAPAAAREKALAWQCHIREVESGLPGGAGSGGEVRAEYDPHRWTLAEREQAKARELTTLGFGRVSRSTVQRMRLAYRRQGLWGLVDHRTTRGPSGSGGRQDEQVVAAVRDVLRGQRGRSKGTVKALMPLAAAHPSVTGVRVHHVLLLAVAVLRGTSRAEPDLAILGVGGSRIPSCLIHEGIAVWV